MGDRQWHSFNKIMYELTQKVTDGEGYRTAMRTFRKGRLQRGIAADAPRLRYRSTEQITNDGKREIVRAFLGNHLVFETNRKAKQGGREGPNAPERLIRMIGELRETRADPMRAALDDAHYENEMMHDLLNKMVSYLHDIGHHSVADAFAIAVLSPHGERRRDSDE